MLYQLLDWLLDNEPDAAEIGAYGESLTVWALNFVRLFGRNGKILRNIYVPKDNGETSEIDVVFITQKGIFVIESKNYSGWIFGNEKDYQWTASLANGEKHRFYNPILQNRTHMKWLQQYLAEDIPLFSVIAFSERCELKKVTVSSPEVYVIQRDELYATIRHIWSENKDILDKQKVEAIYQKLTALTNKDEAFKEAHVSAIRQKISHDNKSICPRCGKQLVLRTARQGVNSGKQFYGCSGYPQCRYIKNI